MKSFKIAVMLLFVTVVSVALLVGCAETKDNNTPTGPDGTECTQHRYASTVIAPTCTLDGSVKNVCEICGHEETETTEALGHQYYNNVCTRCSDELQPTSGLEYKLNDNGTSYSVASIGTATEKDVVISAVYAGKPVKGIGKSAFSGCGSLTSIYIPDSVTSIGERAFEDCNSLTSIKIPDGVTTIGGWAFADCNSFTSVKIPDKVESIGESAFHYCRGLTSVTIGKGVTKIEAGAFNGCYELKEVRIKDMAKWCGISFGPYYKSNPLFYAKKLYLNGNLVADLVIPDGVTAIGKCAFYNCSSLKSVKIPDSVKSIGDSAFSGCDNLTNVVIANGLTTIEGGAFYRCSKLSSLTLPDTLTSIGSWVFDNGSSLTSINYGGTVSKWQSVNKEYNWNGGLGNYTIYCTDGEVAKDGTVTYK